MVSFWPWRGNDSSPASFEKTLSTLSTKIAASQARLDRTSSTSRRVKVLWTLYLSFAYLVCAIVLFLVVGWRKMGIWEWTGMAGGPVLIYATRTVLAAYFNFRIDSLTAKLKEQQSERAKTIQKLKDATKYDTTLELLEKYGEPEGKSGRGKKQATGNDPGGKQGPGKKVPNNPGSGPGTPGRTNISPPPTANIQHRIGPVSAPGTPQPGLRYPVQASRSPVPLEASAEFAPNAFGPPPTQLYQQSDSAPGSSHWYDRIMDLLLGEDETAAKNRIVLICERCRLVNGQAPPGTKSLAELGKWKCMGCGLMNGELDEGKRLVKEVLDARKKSQSVEPDDPDLTDEDLSNSKYENQDDSSDLVEVEKDDDSAEAKTTGKEDTGAGARRRKGKSKK